MALPREYGLVLDAVRGLTWPARRRVAGTLTGSHLSRLRGRAPELSEYRLYRQGDDPRQLDWKLLARSDRPFVRLSDDRAVHPTWLVVDASASMRFPEPTPRKWRAACALAVALAAVAQRAGDPVGACIVGERATLRVAPRTRSDVIVELAAALGSVSPSGSAPLTPALIHIPERARVVAITDLLGDESPLRKAAASRSSAGGDVHLVHILSRDELEPPVRTALAADPEDPTLLRPLDEESRVTYQSRFAEWRAETARAWRLSGVAYREVIAEDDLARAVRAIATSLPERG